jgi:hypothetical protein
LSPATVQPLSSAQRSLAAAIQWISGLRSWAPAVLFGFRLWASVCLALYVAFWLQLDNAYWTGTSAAIVCQPQLGASLPAITADWPNGVKHGKPASCDVLRVESTR